MTRTGSTSLRNTLQRKIILRAVLFIMAPAFLFMLAFFILWNRHLESSIVAGIDRSTRSLAELVRLDLERHETLLKELRADPRVRALLVDVPGTRQEELLADIYQRLKGMGSSAVINGVSLDGRQGFSTYRLPEAYRTEAPLAEWGLFHLMQQSPGEVAALRQSQSYSRELETDYALGLVVTDERGRVIGYLMADLPFSRTVEQLETVSRVQMVFALSDRFDRVVFSQERRLVDAFQRLKHTEGEIETSLDGVRYHISRHPVGKHDLTALGIGDIEHVRSSFFMGLLTISSIILLSSIGMVSMLFLSVRRLIKPLRDMLGTMEAVSRGNLGARIDIRSGDEFEQINERFNQLASDMESMVSRLLAQMEQAKEAEIRQLEAQLNPHFLYNTLDAASWMVRMGESAKADAILADMAKVLRYSLDRRHADRLVALKDDLEMTRTYLRIHQVCLGDKLAVCYGIDESALACRVPRLLLQPLVENAVLHGIHEAGGGTISIRIRRMPPCLEISISDTGPGFAEAPAETAHLGLELVRRRLALHYGEQQTFRIERPEGGGCVVSMTLPDNTEVPPC